MRCGKRTDYPGGLGGFQPRQTDGAGVGGLKLVCGSAVIADYKVAAITLKVSGRCNPHCICYA